MAEMAYTRKYRPVSLDDYMGEETKLKIRNRLKDEKNFPQTILLHGTRGTGKTTLARLIAKEYLCLDRKDGRACGVCEMCQSLDEELINAEFGASTLGVREVNVGTENGKEAMESLLDEMVQQPSFAYRYSIFILDECHMMTRPAQNALLKVLEEPPAHLCVILATTEPDKMLGTIRDRCQLRVKMRPATTEDLMARLEYICRQEGIRTSKEALKMITVSCKKNPRDCIMTLESVAKNFDNDCTIKNVMAERGELETAIYADYIRCANSSDPIADTLRFCDRLDGIGVTPIEFISGLSDFVIRCISAKHGIGIEDMTQEMADAAKELFSSYKSDEVDTILQIMEHANRMAALNEKMGQLTLLNTAMRISKVKLLAVGLQRVEVETVHETEKGARKAAEIHKEELNAKQATSVKLNDSMLLPVFGRSLKEVSGGIGGAIVDTDSDNEPADDGSLSDEALMKLFG